MIQEDKYYTIENNSIAEYKDRGSKFIAYLFPAWDLKEFEQQYVKIQEEHHKARHHCYAYRLNVIDPLLRANDDGEPKGSAGLPILNQLKSFDLSNCAIVVVRYFGGTKLGVSGLIKAYKTASVEAINNNLIVEKYLKQRIKVSFDYSQMGKFMGCLKKSKFDIKNKSFTESPFVLLEDNLSSFEKNLIAFKAALLDISIEEFLNTEPQLSGFKFDLIND